MGGNSSFVINSLLVTHEKTATLFLYAKEDGNQGDRLSRFINSKEYLVPKTSLSYITNLIPHLETFIDNYAFIRTIFFYFWNIFCK